MGSLDLSPLYRSSIGFDRLGALLDSALGAEQYTGDYPPCNIEITGENRYRITLAVPGFHRDELELEASQGVLKVRGQKAGGEEKHRYLHHGISDRSFERKFSLADFVEVRGASLQDGLLCVDLVREVPDAMRPRRIDIKTDSEPLNAPGERRAVTESESG